jgi:hypothetical protein
LADATLPSARAALGANVRVMVLPSLVVALAVPPVPKLLPVPATNPPRVTALVTAPCEASRAVWAAAVTPLGGSASANPDLMPGPCVVTAPFCLLTNVLFTLRLAATLL